MIKPYKQILINPILKFRVNSWCRWLKWCRCEMQCNRCNNSNNSCFSPSKLNKITHQLLLSSHPCHLSLPSRVVQLSNLNLNTNLLNRSRPSLRKCIRKFVLNQILIYNKKTTTTTNKSYLPQPFLYSNKITPSQPRIQLLRHPPCKTN